MVPGYFIPVNSRGKVSTPFHSESLQFIQRILVSRLFTTQTEFVRVLGHVFCRRGRLRVLDIHRSLSSKEKKVYIQKNDLTSFLGWGSHYRDFGVSYGRGNVTVP